MLLLSGKVTRIYINNLTQNALYARLVLSIKILQNIVIHLVFHRLFRFFSNEKEKGHVIVALEKTC